MKYIAILGRQPEFGLAELESVLGPEYIQPFGQYAAILNSDAGSPVKPGMTDEKRRNFIDIDHLGGTLKIGRVIYRGPRTKLVDAPVEWDKLPISGSKTPFGLSMYGISAGQQVVMATGLELKKRLKHRGALRFVATTTGTELTAAQIKFNNIIDIGFELLVVGHQKEMIVAITEQIQDIDWYSKRDYDRPARSAKVGMLPPKLAQIMVNTTSGPTYDPFCGTGVVIQEALLMNRAASGSDLDEAMVEASRINLDWLSQQRQIGSWSIDLADARTVTLPAAPLSIVSEGYLGPNMSRQPTAEELGPVQAEMNQLIEESLANWRHQLPVGSDVTITLPQWQTASGALGMDIIDHLPDLGYTLRSFAHTNTRELVYRRPNQIVGRQLLLIRTL